MKVLRKPNNVHVIILMAFCLPSKSSWLPRDRKKDSSVSLLCPFLPLPMQKMKLPALSLHSSKSPHFLCCSPILSTKKTLESAHFVFAGKGRPSPHSTSLGYFKGDFFWPHNRMMSKALPTR